MGVPIYSKEFSLYFNCDVSITVDSSVLGYATDFDFKINNGEIDITTLDDTEWGQVMMDVKRWECNFSGLVTRTDASLAKYDYDKIEDYMLNNDNIKTYVVFRLNVASNQFQYGQGLLSSIEKSGSVEGVVSYSGSVKGLTLDTSILDPSALE